MFVNQKKLADLNDNNRLVSNAGARRLLPFHGAPTQHFPLLNNRISTAEPVTHGETPFRTWLIMPVEQSDGVDSVGGIAGFSETKQWFT